MRPLCTRPAHPIIISIGGSSTCQSYLFQQMLTHYYSLCLPRHWRRPHIPNILPIPLFQWWNIVFPYPAPNFLMLANYHLIHSLLIRPLSRCHSLAPSTLTHPSSQLGCRPLPLISRSASDASRNRGGNFDRP
jgi:hypothetical protein